MASIFDQDAPLGERAAPARAPALDLFAGDQPVEAAAPADVAAIAGSGAPPGRGYGLTPALIRGVSFGLSDPIAAAGGATGGTLAGQPGSWLDQYRGQLAEERRGAARYAAEHPYLSGGAGVLGSLAAVAPAIGGAAAALPSLGRQILSGAGLGAGAGAATAASETERSLIDEPGAAAGDIGRGLAAGGAIGAAAPVVGAVGGRLMSPLARALSTNAVENQAVRVIGGRVGEDVAARGQDIPSLQTAIAGVPAGKPMTLVDLGDPNLQALGGKIARQPGEGRAIALNAFGDRTGEAASRIVADIDQGISPLTGYDAQQTLLAQRKAAAAPAYDRFYQAPPLNPDVMAPGGDLAKLLQRPSMQDATRRALRIAQEEGRDPASLGITFNAAGDPVFERVPSWQTLDYVKRGLDDHLDQWPRNPFTGKLELDENGRAALGTQRAFVGFVDKNNPEYAAAREAWAGPSAALGALKQGEKFRTLGPQQITDTIAGFSPSEREFYRIGAADALRQGATATGDVRGLIGSNAANQRGASRLTEQLRPLFTDDAAFERFVGRAQSEAKMLETQARVIGGSPTAARVAEDAGGVGGVVAPLAASISGFAAGEPVLGGTQLATALGRLARLPEINAPSVNAAIARRLYSTDPAIQQETLARLLALPSPAGMRIAAPAGGLAGHLVTGGGLGRAVDWGAAALPFLRGQQPAP
jgi:hypothetical protein